MMELWNIGIMDFGRVEDWENAEMGEWGNG
jgi:hypothetical protein